MIRGLAAIAAAVALLVIVGGVHASLAWAGLAPVETIAGAALALLVAGAGGFHLLMRRMRTPLKRLADETRVIADANPAHRIAAGEDRDIDRLVDAINTLAERYHSASTAMEPTLRTATAAADEEKQRLAALVAQLSQSVVVCDPDGRILLYNQSARRLLDPAASGPRAGRGEPLGLGRSIYRFIDRQLVAHALEKIHIGQARSGVEAASRFVATSPSKRLLRVRVAPVRGWSDATSLGFILTLDDVTEPLEAAQRVDDLVQSLTAQGRASAANIRTAVETLQAIPDLDQAQRQALIGIIHDEAAALSERLNRAEAEYAASLESQVSLEPMRAADLVAAAGRRIEAKLGIGTTIEAGDGPVFLRAESFALVQALTYLASRLKYQLEVAAVTLRTARDGRLVYVDLAWSGTPIALATWQQWATQPLRLGGESSPLSLVAILGRHRGEVWYQPHQEGAAAGQPYVRLSFPAIDQEVPVAATTGAAFDLRRVATAQDPRLQRLDALVCTAFAAETDTAGGERPRIGALAAMRVVNGRLLDDERVEADGFEPIESRLPRFAAFCGDTVLVTHDAARVLPALREREAATGTRFAQPILDTRTLLGLAGQEGDELIQAAARLGVDAPEGEGPAARARLVAQVFLKLIPLLDARGLGTLGAVLDAAATRSFFAKR